MFTLIDASPLRDYDSTCRYYRHHETGLEVLHLANPDPENLFAFAFRTTPTDSTGAAHILEHSVLCGSAAYPLADPFVRLSNQSLKTFLNALTHPDKTVYPAASVVEEDYFNLMAVYGDAVFFPLLEERTFLQEGWRRAGRALQGVVYNEMKGVYSSLDTVAAREAWRSCLAGTPYEHDSGGDPRAIPRLTYEAFCRLHRRWYRPDNCLLFLYGNIPFETQAAFLETRLLGRMPGEKKRMSHRGHSGHGDTEHTQVSPPCPLCPPWETSSLTACLRQEIPGPTSEKGAIVTLSWVLGETNGTLAEGGLGYMDAVFLWELLTGHDASPLTKALIDSRLGEDLASSGGVECDIAFTTLTAGLRGVKGRDAA
jgi:Zn-dependent M16 (insulinase) family peptidase